MTENNKFCFGKILSYDCNNVSLLKVREDEVNLISAAV